MFISVIPALKMPFGHCFFDYEISEGEAHIGDLILVPFRNQMIAGLVAKKSPKSAWADKAIKISNPRKIAKLPESIADFCIISARESFVSPPTMLNAWLRKIPKRFSGETHISLRNTTLPKDAKKNEVRYLVNRYVGALGIIETVTTNQANGRVLLLTPWKHRVEFLSTKLGAPSLHKDIAYGEAWRIWMNFLNNPHGILIATRLGAWLSIIADVVILDEPENDDFKQDELTPRYDARRIVKLAYDFNPSMRIISIGTTPNLADFAENAHLASMSPTIDSDIEFARLDTMNRSPLEMLTNEAFTAMEEAVLNKNPIRILHTVLGMRGRVRCADCDWLMECASCKIGLRNMQNHALCPRCENKTELPMSCPRCGSTNLSKAIIGSEGLLKICMANFPNADIKVLDLHEWVTQPIQQNSLLIITNIAYIGGYVEDIRKQERLVLAFRRFASQACVAKCKLIFQGLSPLIDIAPSWLEPQGLAKQWELEIKDRQEFLYPPTQKICKLIQIGKSEHANMIKLKLEEICVKNPDWRFRGPYPIERFAKTREPRSIFHILPSKTATRTDLINELSVLTAYGIVDLDPIAFFC